MSRRERETRVRLDGMSEEQLAIVRDTLLGMLVGRASDLHLLNKHPDPRGAIKQVAALGRLAFWLDDGVVVVPDWAAREVMGRIVEEIEEMDADLIERYGEAVAQHVALRAFLAHLSEGAA
ncbi:MAG TPA: hypothetical protein VGI17_12155 [Solirubrobacterales bacterium]|jgi:hypothetical protein